MPGNIVLDIRAELVQSPENLLRRLRSENTDIHRRIAERFRRMDFGYGNKGIACGLNNLQKIRDGEPLGGKASAESDFASDEDDDFLN